MADKTFNIDIKTGLSNPGAFQQASQGLGEVSSATHQLSGETAKLTQELADLEAGERSLKTTFGGATKERMDALRAELALRKEVTAETKAATEAHIELKKAADEPSLTHEDKSFKGAVKDIRQNRRAEGAIEGFMHQGPEQFLTMGVVRVIESITEAAGPAIAAIAGIGLAFETGKHVLDTWIERVPHLKEEFSNLGAAAKENFGDVLEGVFGEGSGVLAGVRRLIVLLGGETEEMKRMHAPIEGLIGQHERVKTSTERWEAELVKLNNTLGLAKQAITNLAAEQKELNALQEDQANNDFAAEIEEINNNEALSTEEKAVRSIAAEKKLADAKAFYAAQNRATALQAAEEAYEEAQKAQQAQEEAVKQQLERAKNIDAIKTERAKQQAAETNKETASKVVEASGEEDLSDDAEHWRNKAKDTEKARIDAARFEEEAKKAKALADAIAEELSDSPLGPAPTTKEGSEAEAKQRDKLIQEAKDSADKLQKEKEDLESKRRQDDVAILREKAAATERDRKFQTRTDKATGTGNSPGALGPDGFNRPGIDEQAEIDAAKKAEKSGKPPPGAPASSGTGSGGSGGSSGGGGGGVNEGPVLRQIEVNTRGGGGSGGGGGGGSGGHGSAGGSPSGSPGPSRSPGIGSKAAPQGPSSFDDYKTAKRAFDDAQAAGTSGDDLNGLEKAAKAAGNAAGVNLDGSYKAPSQVAEANREAARAEAEKAADDAKREKELEMDDRIYGTHTAHPADPGAAAPQDASKQAPESGGKPGHSNSAVTGHGQSPQEVGRTMGEAAGEIVATKVHAAITEGDKAKMAKIAQEDHDAAVAGHPRVIGMQSNDPNQNTGKGHFAAGGDSGMRGYGMGSNPKPADDPAAADPDPFAHQQQPHREMPAGTQVTGLPDTSGFAGLAAMAAHMGTIAGHVGDMVSTARILNTHARVTRGRVDHMMERLSSP